MRHDTNLQQGDERLNVLITGGAGFIGSHMAEALLSRGNSVEIIDDLSTGSIGNIEHLKSIPISVIRSTRS